MSWTRQSLNQVLADTYAAEGGPDFVITVPEHDMSAVLVQLQHLKKLGTITSFNRRLAQTQDERDDAVYVYGYTE